MRRLQDIRSKNESIKRHFERFVGHWHAFIAFSKEVESHLMKEVG
jgi:hypothetical protein